MNKKKKLLWIMLSTLILANITLVIGLTLLSITPVIEVKQLKEEEAKEFFQKLGTDYKVLNVTKEGLVTATETSDYSPIQYAVWKADINNNHRADYALIEYSVGSGHYDFINFYAINREQKLIKLDLILQNRAYPSNVDSPPIIVENEKTYIMLENIS